MKEATWKTRSRWENNIKGDFQEVGWGGVDSIWLKIWTGGKRF